MDDDVKKFLHNGSLTGRLMHAYHLMLSANIPLEDAAICRDAVDFVAEEQRKCLAALDTIRRLENKLVSERVAVAMLKHALKTARCEAFADAVQAIRKAGQNSPYMRNCTPSFVRGLEDGYEAAAQAVEHLSQSERNP